MTATSWMHKVIFPTGRVWKSAHLKLQLTEREHTANKETLWYGITYTLYVFGSVKIHDILPEKLRETKMFTCMAQDFSGPTEPWSKLWHLQTFSQISSTSLQFTYIWAYKKEKKKKKHWEQMHDYGAFDCADCPREILLLTFEKTTICFWKM